MPIALNPMRAVTGEVPTDDDGWAYELKWDGMRAVGFCDRGTLTVHSANGLDATLRFPELDTLAASLGDHQVVVDGEIVTFAPDGRPNFGLLQGRMHLTSAGAAAQRARTQPVVYVLFDLLWFDGLDVTGAPYLDRRRLLEDFVEPGPSWTVPQPQFGGGTELFAAVADRGLEGLVAKRIDSVYEPGRRSSAWRKLKVRRRQELVVGGWLPGTGHRASTLGALLVGYYDDDTLHYAGRVGTGFTDPELKALLATLTPLARSSNPFSPPPPRTVARQARWIEPRLVVEVAFAEWTAAGVLRHPSYIGRRTDKDPGRVVREPTR